MTRRKFTHIILWLVAISAILFGAYFYFKLSNLENTKVDSKTKEINQIISKVEKIYLFPDEETPTLATVSDPSKTYFKNSIVGDKVLFFSKSGKAVLYRPENNKIIEIIKISTKTNNIDVPSINEN